jgi:hypothetical protein
VEWMSILNGIPICDFKLQTFSLSHTFQTRYKVRRWFSHNNVTAKNTRNRNKRVKNNYFCCPGESKHPLLEWVVAVCITACLLLQFVGSCHVVLQQHRHSDFPYPLSRQMCTVSEEATVALAHILSHFTLTILKSHLTLHHFRALYAVYK